MRWNGNNREHRVFTLFDQNPLIFGVLWKTIWAFCVLFWPLIKWVVALEVLWRLLLVVYHRDDPDIATPGGFSSCIFRRLAP